MDSEIFFRRTVSNIFRRLNRQDVQQIAYVRLKGKEDTKKYSASNAQDTSLDLMESLEQYGYFSEDNVDGLIEILKDANRADLVKKAEREMRKKRRSGEHPLHKEGSVEELLGSPTDETSKKWENGKARRVLPEPDQRVPPLHSEDPKDKKKLGGVRHVPSPSQDTMEKKVPMLPPNMAQKRVIQESSPTSSKKLVTLSTPKQPSILSLPGKSETPLSKPQPPPRQIKREEEKLETGEGRERDSGMWTGSAYDTPSEWTKHHTSCSTYSKGDNAGTTEYQHLGDIDNDNQYTTPSRQKHTK